MASREVLAAGFHPRCYWSMLAADLGLRFCDDLKEAAALARTHLLTTEAVRQADAIMVRIGGKSVLVVAPKAEEIGLLRRHLAANPALGRCIRIAAPETIRAFIVARRHRTLTHYAVNRLATVLPPLSSGRQARRRGASGPTALFAALIATGLCAPLFAFAAASVLCTLCFFNCSAWKAAAALHRGRPMRVEPVSAARLPAYTVLIPLYREASVVRDLVRHVSALDYPAAKLQVLILLEADDAESRAAVERHAAGSQFEVLVVPPGAPRTKPRALTYALPFVRGELVVVYDAEDRPEPDQLRKAAAAFREYPELGCVQARLTPDNDDSFFARMFVLEYAANFDVLLPALADWRVPLPLGGTSNHFPRSVLEEIGGWDPFNVTEDADLGLRLARFGYRSATILSRTFEEAPVTFRQWLPQRRRWIKGWMQTAVLCLKRDIPVGLRLPMRHCLAIHGILIGGVLGLLLYPASLLTIAAAAVAAWRNTWPADPLLQMLLALNLVNLAAIVAAAAVSAARGLRAVGALRLVVYIPLLPAYWALMSLAAWQALLQYFRSPSQWEKTTHGVARHRCRRPWRRRLC